MSWEWANWLILTQVEEDNHILVTMFLAYWRDLDCGMVLLKPIHFNHCQEFLSILFSILIITFVKQLQIWVIVIWDYIKISYFPIDWLYRLCGFYLTCCITITLKPTSILPWNTLQTARTRQICMSNSQTKMISHEHITDELAHLILSYALLFSPVYYFLSIADPPPCTTLTWPPMWLTCSFATTIDSTPYQSHYWPGTMFQIWHMTSISFQCPVVGLLVTSHHAMWSGPYHLFHHTQTLCSFLFIICT